MTDDKNLNNDSDEKQKGPQTAILNASNTPSAIPRPIGKTRYFKHERELILVVRGWLERVSIPESNELTLGRADHLSRSQPDVDLTPFGALDRGVSRVHARLHIEEDRLYVTDLGSTNGTFLAEKRMEPNVPYLLKKGDELQLGRLGIQILFR